jgi:hypothetical protein
MLASACSAAAEGPKVSKGCVRKSDKPVGKMLSLFIVGVEHSVNTYVLLKMHFSLIKTYTNLEGRGKKLNIDYI